MAKKELRAFSDLREMLRAVARRGGTKTALREKRDGIYQDISFGLLCEETEALCTALGELLPPDSRVVVWAKKSVACVRAHLALLSGAGVPVPADATLDAAGVAAIVARVGAAAVLCDAARAAQLPPLEGVRVLTLEELSACIDSGRERVTAGESAWAQPLDAHATAAVFLTMGSAKGVMLSHANICHTLFGIARMTAIDGDDVFLSVLPLSHAYEYICGLLAPLSLGATVALGEGLPHLLYDLRQTAPTCMVSVPYLAEAIYERLCRDIADHGAEKRLRRTTAVAQAVRLPALGRIVRERMLARERALLGGKLSRMLILGGNIDPSVQEGLSEFGILALQGYAVTECAALAALCADGCQKSGTAGRALPDCMLDIYNVQPDGYGEIRCKGPNVMSGYLGDEARTAEALRDGWFYTGDFGYIDADGLLHVIGRKQNGIRVAGGRVVSPEELEILLARGTLVREVAVVAAPDAKGKDYQPVAQILPDRSAFDAMMGAEATDELLEHAIGEWVDEVNAALPAHKRIGAVALVEKPFARDAAGRILRTALTAE